MSINKYTAKDIEICENGISIENTYFSKKQIADAFNELFLMREFIERQCE